MTKFYPVAVILFLLICVAAIVMAGGRLAYFLSIPSLLVVVVSALVMSLANFRLGEIGRAFALAFRSSGSRAAADRGELEKALAFFDALLRYLLIAGLVGTMIGTITMLGNLGNVERIGRGSALALTTIFYALLLWVLVVVPGRTGIRQKLAELEE
mgnify:CR=1 FL=1